MNRFCEMSRAWFKWRAVYSLVNACPDLKSLMRTWMSVRVTPREIASMRMTGWALRRVRR